MAYDNGKSSGDVRSYTIDHGNTVDISAFSSGSATARVGHSGGSISVDLNNIKSSFTLNISELLSNNFSIYTLNGHGNKNSYFDVIYRNGFTTIEISDGRHCITISIKGNPFGYHHHHHEHCCPAHHHHGCHPICFLENAMIRTPSGDVAIQELAIGDEVVAYVEGRAQSRSVVWAGKGHVKVRAGLPDDEAGYPIRILVNAISEGVPYKDLLVTPEHCFFFDGGFVPARMLVNGRSVFYDRSVSAYDYFHVETREHSIIMADGMLTESYLDTGNRDAMSQNHNVVVRLSAGPRRSWADDAAAPLVVERDAVEPLYRRIENRAVEAGLEAIDAPVLTTQDADMHLVTDQGQVILRTREAGNRVMFTIAPGIETVRIVSRTSRPSDVTGPFLNDRRQLGVLVGEITLFDSGEASTLDRHLQEPQARGWDVVEGTPCRWTNGDAWVSLGDRAPGSVGLLAIEVLAAGPYLEAEARPEPVAVYA